MEQGTTTDGRRGPRDWPRVLGLFGVVLMTSVFVHPGVVIGVPLALLLAVRGFENLLSAAVAGLVVLIVAGGRAELVSGLWYAERAWGVLLGGSFVALGLVAPAWRLTSRALGATIGAAAIAAGTMAARPGSWARIDEAVSRIVFAATDTAAATVRNMGGSAEMVEAAESLAAAQVSVFPALLGIESLAALGVAWWARSRLLGEPDTGLAPLNAFRFNDHLVWVMVAGLLLVVLAQPETAWVRVGSNTLVFMGALYALRGAAVFVFVSGGLSLVTTVVLMALLMFVPTVLFGTAALIGIGDTWLDLRARTVDAAG